MVATERRLLRRYAEDAAEREREDRSTRRRNLRTLLLSMLFAGLGHLSLGHTVTGTVLAVLFLAALDGTFLGTVLLSDPRFAERLFWISAPSAILVWLIGVIHGTRISFGRDPRVLREKRCEFLKKSLISSLQGHLGQARRNLKRALRHDPEGEDAALHFHFGIVELRLAEQAEAQGDARAARRRRAQARRAFRRCVVRDGAEVWREHIRLQCERSRVKLPRGM